MTSSQSYHGLFLINKDSGMTSHDVVHRLRRILGTSSVGHSGTLDPLADGLLILLAGEATKLSNYILEGNKSYHLEMKLGLTTDTLDVTGAAIEEKPVDVSTAMIRSRECEFAGEKEWRVPKYSAIKIKGKKLYEYARADEPIETPKKLMKFWDVEFLQHEGDRVQFHLHCSKGSYIRTWINEFGQSLGCGAAMSRLTRTSSDPFHLNQAQNLNQIESELKSGRTPVCFVPLDRALPQAKNLRVKGLDQKLLKNGQISHDLRLRLIQICDPEKDRVMLVSTFDSQPVALIGFEPQVGFVIRRVFHFETSKDSSSTKD